jgi:hypothetical protein
MSVAAEPASGSEIATAIVASPAVVGGSHRSRCSGVPSNSTTRIAPTAASKMANAGGRHSLPNSSSTSRASSSGACQPPYSSGSVMPR